MSRTALIERLQRTLGLDPQSIGETTLLHAIDEACVVLQARDASELLARVSRSAAAWQSFVDCMVVPETWLFRVPEQFDDLLRYARALPAGRRPLRVLSLPCASGEEAWSIAATLLQGGFAACEFEVIGVDVSARAIAQARQARYRRSALRGRPANLDWFHWEDEWLCPAPMLRRSVRFRCGNVLAPDVFAAGEQFDAIFCRNLLIYLDEGARRQALARLLEVLAPDGMLVAGQAEVLSAIDPRLAPLAGFGPLSFGRARGVRDPAPAANRAAPAPRPAAVAPAAHPVRAQRAPAPRAPARENPTNSLERAQQAADAGALDEARRLCRALLAQDAESAPGWFLLGTIDMASGDLDAAEHAFARASYLDRGHQDALLHRAALAERRGRAAEAAQLRLRLQRVRSPGAAP
ncbi:MAG: methyltransferase domain-containing protein [Rhodanobacteraceae bacterium]|nr:methyltransferase domain-containing protein [Rhodanobacteraceae bacterium]